MKHEIVIGVLQLAFGKIYHSKILQSTLFEGWILDNRGNHKVTILSCKNYGSPK